MNLQDHKSCLAEGVQELPLPLPLYHNYYASAAPFGLVELESKLILFHLSPGPVVTQEQMGNERRGINFHLTRYILCKHFQPTTTTATTTTTRATTTTTTRSTAALSAGGLQLLLQLQPLLLILLLTVCCSAVCVFPWRVCV